MTLTQAATITRRFILFFIIITILGISTFIGFKIWSMSTSRTTEADIRPDAKFGILPLIDYPKTATSSANFSYTLNIGSNGLPDFPKVAKVYFILKPTGILSADQISSLAKQFNFASQPTTEDTKYTYQEGNMKLIVDTDSGNFLYQKEATPSSKNISDDNKLVTDFKQLLDKIGLLKDDLKNGTAKISVLQDSSLKEISLWPEDLDSLHIITPEIKRSLVFAEVTGPADDMNNFSLINYTFYPIDKTTPSIYPLKTSNEAFQGLQAGNGIALIFSEKRQITITSVYLAYFQPDIYTPYLQPVVVFEGQGFVGIVPAVTDQYISPAR